MKSNNCILLVYGTRPEYIKIKPIINILDKNKFQYKVLFTGQQVDIASFEYDYRIEIPNIALNRLDTIVQSIMNKIVFFNDNKKITHVLVQGDTTSAFAVALTAFHNGIKVIHLEAGLRTYDKNNPYPEEINRQLISRIADIHLCPTNTSMNNLNNEGIVNNVFVVGNTVIDNLVDYKKKCEYTNKILITMHRRENHHVMDKWFTEIEKVAAFYPEYEFILPIHPNPNVLKHKDILKHVNVINPLPYDEMLELLIKTRLVITDSGGLQEECSFLNKKCLVCRKITERPEVLNQSSFIVEYPENLEFIFKKHINNYEIDYECPFGDGHSAKKIINVLENL